MNAFDNRLINVTITVDGQTFTYDQGYAIVATGARYTNGNFGECSFRVDNIAKSARDFIVTKTSPWNPQRTTAEVVLNVGRASYGTFQMFQGNAIASSPTQPPDIGLVMHSLSQQALLGYVNAFAAPPVSSVQAIAQQIANMGGLTLDFEATDIPTVGNYHFTGPLGRQIDSLNQLGVYAYVDSSSNTLVVTNPGIPRKTTAVQINTNTGMVGVPEITEVGVRVRSLIRNEIQLGAPAILTSVINPAVNGNYYISKLMFEIASRDTPFYWVMELIPQNSAIGFGNSAGNP